MAPTRWPTVAAERRVQGEAWLRVHERASIVVVAAVAAVARLLYWFSMRAQPLQSDAGQYHEMASYLAGGLGFSHTIPQIELHPTAFRPPLYPVLLSLVYRAVGATQGAGRAVAVITGVAVVVAVMIVMRRHVGALAAAVAGLAVALYPPIIANDTQTLTEGLSLLLIVLLLDALLSRRALWSGVWCGLLVLTRPSAQFLVIAVGLWLLAKVGWRRAALSVAVTVLVVMPWVVRNELVMGAPVIVTTNGFNLAAMYSTPAQERDNFVDPIVDPAFNDLRLEQFDEARWDRLLRDRALADLRRNPGHVVNVVKRNIQAIFELDPSLNRIAEEIDGRNMTVRSWTMPLFYLVTAVGLVGLWRHRRREPAQLVALIAGYFALSSLFLVAPPRLRAPVDLCLCLGLAMLVGGFAGDEHDRPVTAPDDVDIDLRERPPAVRDQTSPANVSV